MPENLLGAATRIKRRAAELEAAEIRARRGDYKDRADARELVFALTDARTVFDQLLAQKQEEYGIRPDDPEPLAHEVGP